MIHRQFSFILHPSAEQENLLQQFAGVCRLIWNLAIEQRRDHWRQFQRSTGDNLNHITQARQLTALRAEFDFIKAVSQDCQTRTLADLHQAFLRFFKGQSGYPNMRRKGQDERFSFAGRAVQIRKINAKWSEIFLPKIGYIRFRSTREVEGRLTDVAVNLTPLGWQISIGSKKDQSPAIIKNTVGIDRGVAIPLMLSDGTSYSLPKRIGSLDSLHKRAQRKAARRRKGSSRRRLAISRAAKIKARQARIRKDWAHRVTTDICRRFGTVIVERLKTSALTKSAKGTLSSPGKNVAQKRGLNRSILNVGWYQIETMLLYKANSLIRVDPAYTSQTCACCGHIDKGSRENQADFHCTKCGHLANADWNAAINIQRRGNTALLDVEGRQFDVPFEASTVRFIT